MHTRETLLPHGARTTDLTPRRFLQFGFLENQSVPRVSPSPLHRGVAALNFRNNLFLNFSSVPFFGIIKFSVNQRSKFNKKILIYSRNFSFEIIQSKKVSLIIMQYIIIIGIIIKCRKNYP